MSPDRHVKETTSRLHHLLQWGDPTTGQGAVIFLDHNLKPVSTIQMYRHNGLWFARIGDGSVEMNLSGHDSASIHRLETTLLGPSSSSHLHEMSRKDLIRTTTAFTESLTFDLLPDPADNNDDSNSNGRVNMAEQILKHVRMVELKHKQPRQGIIPDHIARPSHFQEFNWHQCNIYMHCGRPFPVLLPPVRPSTRTVCPPTHASDNFLVSTLSHWNGHHSSFRHRYNTCYLQLFYLPDVWPALLRLYCLQPWIHVYTALDIYGDFRSPAYDNIDQQQNLKGIFLQARTKYNLPT